MSSGEHATNSSARRCTSVRPSSYANEAKNWPLCPEAPAVEGLGFRAYGLGFRVSGFGYWAQGLGFRVQGFGFWVQDSGFRVWGLGFEF